MTVFGAERKPTFEVVGFRSRPHFGHLHSAAVEP